MDKTFGERRSNVDENCSYDDNTNSDNIDRSQGGQEENKKEVDDDCSIKSTRCSDRTKILLDLPHDVWFRILEFIALPTFRACILCHKIAPLCKASRTFVNEGEKSRALWECLYRADYVNNKSLSTTAKPGDAGKNMLTIRRKSPRKRKTNEDMRQDHRLVVQREHQCLLNRTDNFYDDVEQIVNPFPYLRLDKKRPRFVRKKKKSGSLSLDKLKQLLEQYAPISVHRVSPVSGRTLLQLLCAGEMSAPTIVACIRYLLQEPYRADPNQYSKGESPFADRPILYFAISRAWPTLVQTLLDVTNNSVLKTRVRGHFRMTFDTTRVISGAYTPLEFAQEMLVAEQPNIPPYWANQMKVCIRILREKMSCVEQMKQHRNKKVKRSENI